MGDKFIEDMRKYGYTYMGDTAAAKQAGLPGLRMSGPRPYVERLTSLPKKRDIDSIPVEVNVTQNLFVPTQKVSFFLHGLFSKPEVQFEILKKD